MGVIKISRDELTPRNLVLGIKTILKNTRFEIPETKALPLRSKIPLASTPSI
jgi:hypothetical protein